MIIPRLRLRSRPSSADGFTLIELLVVILIIATLMAVAAPSFLGQTGKAQDSTAKQALVIAYKAAKTASLDNPNQGSYALVTKDDLKKVEPEITFADSSADPTASGTINVSHVNTNDLVLKNHSGSGKTCTLTAPMNGIQTMSCKVIPPAPANTALPTISGATYVGDELQTSNGSWSNSPVSYAYQWRLCDSGGVNCSDISGATAVSYTIQTGDAGHTARVVVTATNEGGSAPATSAQSGFIPPPN
jgi:type IV pilus assembly protein PilA